MPSVNIQGLGTVNFPDSMSPDQIQQAIERDIMPKASPSPNTFAQRMEAEKKNFDPTDPSVYPEATFGSTVLAGIGHAIANGARGAAQLQNDLGFGPYYLNGAAKVTRDAVDRQKALDAPLMKNSAGVSGDVAGNIMQALPLAAVPGLNTALGAGAVGTVLGASEPVGQSDSRLKNAAISGGVSATTPAAFGLARGVKALAEPAYQAGRETAVGRLLNRFAGDDPSVIANLKNPQQFVPGTSPTAAEATGNAGLAMLENAAATRDPLVKQALSAQLQGNNAARLNALKTIAGDQTAMDNAVAAREAAAGPLYATAKAASAPSDAELNSLLARPSMKSAWARAQDLAKEHGETLVNGVDAPATQATTGILDASGNQITREIPATQAQYSGKALHYLKMALDDMSNPNAASGIGAHEQRALMGTRDSLLNWMDANIPGYGAARAAYAAGSQPINQMQVGQELYNKLSPALNDFGGTSRMRAQAFADAVRNGDQTAQRATGFPAAKMDTVMSPDQMATITNVGKDLSRRAGVEDMMRGIGSNTSQNIAAQNFMGQLFGPLGLPQSWGQRLVSGMTSIPWVGPVSQFALKGAEEQLQRELARGLLSPSAAAAMMERAQPKLLGPVAQGALRYVPVGRAGLLSLVTQPSQQ